MKRISKRLLIISTICVLVIAAVVKLLIYEGQQNIRDLKKQSQYLIGKVEEYKKRYHKLPQYEADMKLNLPDDYPVHYNITKDSAVYVVGFQIAPFEDLYYQSDSQKWYCQH